MQKIPCGGFYLDDTLKVDENNTLGLAPGAGGVRSDWNVNDASNPAYIKNRICYKNTESIVGEKIVITDFKVSSDGSRAEALYDSIYLELGHKWQIIIHRENKNEDMGEYTVKADENGTYLVFPTLNSNSYLSIRSTVTQISRNYFTVGNDNIVSIELIGVSGERNILKKIDEEFIPSELFKVTFTVDEDNKPIADKTFAEIQEAYEAGKYIYATVYPQVYNLEYADNNAFVFSTRNGSFIFQVTVNNDNSFFFECFFVLPPPTEHDNNKTIRVVDGNWKLSNELILPSSTPDSTKQFKITVDDSGAITATEITT